MTEPDKKRNKRLKRDVEKGLSITELARKYKLSKRQISRLKKELKPEKQITRKPESQTKIKATFQIPESLFMQIKIKAAQERKGISDLVGEILERYLK